MWEILGDSTWQSVFVLLAIVVSIIVPYIIYDKQSRRRISYCLISDDPLLSVKKEVEGDLKIFFKGTQVKNVHHILIGIINSGHTPIKSNEFERPLSFSFGKESKILSAEIVKAKPSSLKPSVEVGENSVIVSKILINSGDFFKLGVLVKDFEGIEPDGRIVGVKAIEKYHETKAYTTLFFIGFFLTFISIFAIFFSIIRMASGFAHPFLGIDVIYWMVILTFGISLAFVGILMPTKRPFYEESV